MPVNRNMKHKGMNSVAAITRKPRPKASGTRAVILEDWREGTGKAGKSSGAVGNTLRDGR
jgi:hypothetical protein